MPSTGWKKGERYDWCVVRDRGCDQPSDDTIATFIQTLEFDWPPAMAQLRAAQNRARSVSPGGQNIEAYFNGRFDEVVIAGRGHDAKNWSVSITKVQPT